MNVELTAHALDDLAWLVRHETRLAKRTLQLIEDIRRSPFEGIGKPEALKGELSGWWSRRIDSKHRLVYRVLGRGEDRHLQIVQCRHHY
ncbi:Txe/YoeB family addiction module toxin [Maricaulis parjimensis]|uniref:Txe/YoeB family addiction module toxin n=1 Tax=Maricaulis parjimensis TaxID=144023 RepID=UPI001939B2C2|nr:Txe/YoeB family addiction module toxin [Maricaulis parjimensis]